MSEKLSGPGDVIPHSVLQWRTHGIGVIWRNPESVLKDYTMENGDPCGVLEVTE